MNASPRRWSYLKSFKVERIGVADLHCQDLQNVLCETDKYLRGKPKRRYPAV